MMRVEFNTGRVIGTRDFMIYGHFLEHFHRQIYGGIYDPTSQLSDEHGFRTDVMEALQGIQAPIIRWPGGCFVSAYDWKKGIGRPRIPHFDKAWRVEESNEFGTDEFIAYCRAIGTEPYICTNLGTGAPEDISDWVEYCNLECAGKWAKLRAENGHPEPYNVKYWSIGNENYGDWEMGAKSANEWGRLVKETAKMMKRVDPKIQLLAASVPDLDWNIALLKEAGSQLDWISIHGYWDRLHQENNLSNYETSMAYTMEIETPIQKTRHILGSLGYLGKIHVAYDEWNLRGWHHPNILGEDYLDPRDKNDINSSYTMADAVFTACFLNQCLKHCDLVRMANFSPTVNTRGAIFTHKDGIVLRSTYSVFSLYTKHMGDQVIDCWVCGGDSFAVDHDGHTVEIPSLDVIATKSSSQNDVRIAIVNRHPDAAKTLEFEAKGLTDSRHATLYSVTADSKNAYNDIDKTMVFTSETKLNVALDGRLQVECQPHSVNVLVWSAE